MNRNIYVIFFSLAFCLIACRQYPHIQPLLQEAETLMGSRPDSSLILLESIPSPEKLSEEDYATWCLLMTQARDKNYVEHTSDSVIGVAVRYFEKQGPKDGLDFLFTIPFNFLGVYVSYLLVLKQLDVKNKLADKICVAFSSKNGCNAALESSVSKLFGILL